MKTNWLSLGAIIGCVVFWGSNGWSQTPKPGQVQSASVGAVVTYNGGQKSTQRSAPPPQAKSPTYQQRMDASRQQYAEQSRQRLQQQEAEARARKAAADKSNAAFTQHMEASRQQQRQREDESRARQEAFNQKSAENMAKMQQTNASTINSMKSSSRPFANGPTHVGADDPSQQLYGWGSSGFSSSTSSASNNNGRSSLSSGYKGSTNTPSNSPQAQQRAQAEAMARARDEELRRSTSGLYSGFGKGLANGGNGLPETSEAPWGFGPLPTSVSLQQAGMPPQPDGATFVTDDGEVRSVGYSGGADNYVNNYMLQREMAGRPLPSDFFDTDPAIVSYDGVGNPIDRYGFVVEYQSPADRRAAIIEARAAAMESSLEQAEMRRRFERPLEIPPAGSMRIPFPETLETAMDRFITIIKNAREQIQARNPQPQSPKEAALQDFYRRWNKRSDEGMKAIGKSRQPK